MQLATIDVSPNGAVVVDTGGGAGTLVTIPAPAVFVIMADEPNRRAAPARRLGSVRTTFVITDVPNMNPTDATTTNINNASEERDNDEDDRHCTSFIRLGGNVGEPDVDDTLPDMGSFEFVVVVDRRCCAIVYEYGAAR